MPEKIKNALDVVLGESIDSVEIIKNNWRLKITGTYATTRVNTIYLRGSAEEFFTYDFTVLEEYYHVVKQWNTGAMTRSSYMAEYLKNGYDNNRFEIEAKTFAGDNLQRYRSLINQN